MVAHASEGSRPPGLAVVGVRQAGRFLTPGRRPARRPADAGATEDEGSLDLPQLVETEKGLSPPVASQGASEDASLLFLEISQWL
jgi:hypothetical protein